MDRHDRNHAQLQLLLLEMERQLLIISAMIDKLRSRWGLPGGLSVIGQRRHRRYGGCNAIGEAKRQRNILRDDFMNEGQVTGQMDSS